MYTIQGDRKSSKHRQPHTQSSISNSLSKYARFGTVGVQDLSKGLINIAPNNNTRQQPLQIQNNQNFQLNSHQHEQQGKLFNGSPKVDGVITSLNHSSGQQYNQRQQDCQSIQFNKPQHQQYPQNQSQYKQNPQFPQYQEIQHSYTSRIGGYLGNDSRLNQSSTDSAQERFIGATLAPSSLAYSIPMEKRVFHGRASTFPNESMQDLNFTSGPSIQESMADSVPNTESSNIGIMPNRDADSIELIGDYTVEELLEMYDEEMNDIDSINQSANQSNISHVDSDNSMIEYDQIKGEEVDTHTLISPLENNSKKFSNMNRKQMEEGIRSSLNEYRPQVNQRNIESVHGLVDKTLEIVEPLTNAHGSVRENLLKNEIRNQTKRKRTVRTERISKRVQNVKNIHTSSGFEKNRMYAFQRLHIEHQEDLLSMLQMEGPKQKINSDSLKLRDIARRLYRAISEINANTASPVSILPILFECIQQREKFKDSKLLCSALKILLSLHTECIEIRQHITKEIIDPNIIESTRFVHVTYDEQAEKKCLDGLQEKVNEEQVIHKGFKIFDYNENEIKSNEEIYITNNLDRMGIEIDDEILDIEDDTLCQIIVRDPIQQYSFTYSNDVSTTIFEQILKLFQEKMKRMNPNERILKIIIPLLDSMINHASHLQLQVLVKLFTKGYIFQLFQSEFSTLTTMGVELISLLLLKVPHALDLCHSLQYQSSKGEGSQSILQMVSKWVHSPEEMNFRDIHTNPDTTQKKEDNFFRCYILRTEVLKLYSFIIHNFEDGVKKLCVDKRPVMVVPSLVCMLQKQLVQLLEDQSYSEYRISLIRRVIAILIPMGASISIPKNVGLMDMELDSAYNKLLWIDNHPEEKKYFSFDRRILKFLSKEASL